MLAARELSGVVEVIGCRIACSIPGPMYMSRFYTADANRVPAGALAVLGPVPGQVYVGRGEGHGTAVEAEGGRVKAAPLGSFTSTISMNRAEIRTPLPKAMTAARSRSARRLEDQANYICHKHTALFGIINSDIITCGSIGNFVCDRAAVSTSGNDLITLTAGDVTWDFGTIDFVEIYRDANHNGRIDVATDVQLHPINFDGTAGTYSWSGVMAQGAGTEAFLARAWAGEHASAVKHVSLQVGEATVVPALVSKVGTEALVDPGRSGSESGPLVAYDQSGGSSVAYFDPAAQQVYLQRYDPAGMAIGSPTALSGLQGIFLGDMARLPDGHFVVVWAASATDIRAKEFNADGTPYGNISYVTVPFAGPRIFTLRVAITAPGEFGVVLSSGQFSTVTARYFRYSGGLQVANVLLNDGNTVYSADLAMDARGASLVSWVDVSSGQATAQRFDAGGSPVGTALALNTVPNSVVSGTGRNIAVAVDESGRSVFVWVGYNDATGNGDIYARRFLADGSPVDATEFRINDSLAQTKSKPLVSFRGNRIVITWLRSADPSYDTVQGQAYSWDNTLRRLGGNFIPSTNTEVEQLQSSVDVDYQGQSFFVGWEASRTGSTAPLEDAYFQRFTGLNATPHRHRAGRLRPQVRPYAPNDRLLFGLHGTISKFELVTMRDRLHRAKLNKAKGGELFLSVPNRYVKVSSHEAVIDRDEQVEAVIWLICDKFDVLGSDYRVFRYLVQQAFAWGSTFPAILRQASRNGALRAPPRCTPSCNTRCLPGLGCLCRSFSARYA